MRDHSKFVVTVDEEIHHLSTRQDFKKEKSHAIGFLANERLLQLQCHKMIESKRYRLSSRKSILEVPVVDPVSDISNKIGIILFYIDVHKDLLDFEFDFSDDGLILELPAVVH